MQGSVSIGIGFLLAVHRDGGRACRGSAISEHYESSSLARRTETALPAPLSSSASNVMSSPRAAPIVTFIVELSLHLDPWHQRSPLRPTWRRNMQSTLRRTREHVQRYRGFSGAEGCLRDCVRREGSGGGNRTSEQRRACGGWRGWPSESRTKSLVSSKKDRKAYSSLAKCVSYFFNARVCCVLGSVVCG